MTEPKMMSKEVHEALGLLLDEFGDCDLQPRLEYYADEDRECGRELAAAWTLVETWHNGGDLDPKAIKRDTTKCWEVYGLIDKPDEEAAA
jgi:hypothetical protein